MLCQRQRRRRRKTLETSLKLSIGGPDKMELIIHGDEQYMMNSILE